MGQGSAPTPALTPLVTAADFKAEPGVLAVRTPREGRVTLIVEPGRAPEVFEAVIDRVAPGLRVQVRSVREWWLCPDCRLILEREPPGRHANSGGYPCSGMPVRVREVIDGG